MVGALFLKRCDNRNAGVFFPSSFDIHVLA